MALSSLFRRNAELCTEMASSTKSAEIREQWVALAKHWRQKAEADQPLADMPISPEPLAPSPELKGPCEREEPAQVLTLAPTLVPSEPQLLTVEGRSQVPIENVGDGGALEDVWSQVIADIRTLRSAVKPRQSFITIERRSPSSRMRHRITSMSD